MKDLNNSFLKLVDLSQFLDQQTNLDDCLRDLATLAADIVDTGNCSIMLLHRSAETDDFRLRVFAHHGALPASALQEAAKVSEGIAGRVAAEGKPVLVEDITTSPYRPLARCPDQASKSFISVPIRSGAKVIGVINFSIPNTKHCFDQQDLQQANFVGLLVEKSLNVIQLQNVLQSKFVQLAISRETKELAEHTIAPAIREPDKLAKIVAKTFYREMAKAGFTANQIVEAAGEIISLLNQTLGKHKKRLTAAADDQAPEP